MADLRTYGDLKKVIKNITLKQKGEKIGNVAIDTVISLIPGADVAKTTFDFIKAAISKPDTKKTNTWLDKLDVDDEMSAILDNTVENGFMQAMAKAIELEPDGKPLEQDFNMNAKMVNYLKQQYRGRHISGITEEELDEMSVSGDAGAYSTPFAFKKSNKQNNATQYAQKLGWKIVKKPKTSKIVDYKKMYETTGAVKPKGGKMFIPDSFLFPSILLEPIKTNVGGEEISKVYFKVATNDKGESILMIDPLIKAILDNIERGRTSFEKEQKTSELARYIKEKVPSNIRGLIKKAAQGAKITGNNFIPLNLILTKSSGEYSTYNSKININSNGLNFLRDVKSDYSKGQGKEDQISLLVWLYKNKNNSDNTPKKFSIETGNSIQLSSRTANKLASEGYIDMKKDTEADSNDWYIKNPYKQSDKPDEDNVYGDINVKLYETLKKAVKQEIINEVTYNQFKREAKFRTKSEQLHKAIKDVKKKIQEIDRIVEYTSRMKQELSEDGGINYWKATEKYVGQISEMISHLNNKLKNLNQ